MRIIQKMSVKPQFSTVLFNFSFSLGAQTAGMVANFLLSGKLKRITGLDPAKPLFIFAKNNRKLGKDDAEFVDIIHTDVLQRGVLSTAGHADFYVNGGIEQPGCSIQTNICKFHRFLDIFVLYVCVSANKEFKSLTQKPLEAVTMTEHRNTMPNR